ncbi:unnamed protein product [Protopolystoma xenopodis]|uniref:Uncharacterized protein n=1 Tax=Protopolystoma xenopodis TaxID=117903 RepID=A0A448XB79_9PLAT|nr:unnamed protein product [Protopolystoma xenopodis]
MEVHDEESIRSISPSITCLRQKRWKMSHGLHQIVRHISVKRPQYNANQPASSDSQLPCGGPGRGVCTTITPIPEDVDLLHLNDRLLADDRLAWPTRFISMACTCKGNYWGHACHLCRPGWMGPDCGERRQPRIRRNALLMSEEEQRRFRDRLVLAKRTPMQEWVVLNISSSQNGDPIDVAKINLVAPPSVYDFYVYLHLYATRSSLIFELDVGAECDLRQHVLDFAHKCDKYSRNLSEARTREHR